MGSQAEQPWGAGHQHRCHMGRGPWGLPVPHFWAQRSRHSVQLLYLLLWPLAALQLPLASVILPLQ